MPNKSRTKDRRRFLQTLAAAPIASAIQPLQAQETPSRVGPPAEVDALTHLVQARFGQYLAEGDMAEIKRGIERMLRNSEALNRIKLTNADEPDFMFHPSGGLS